MIRYKITVSYDGTRYHGWQIQPQSLTISQVLQDHFEKVFKKKIKIIGASRTDAGVHAFGQVAAFNSDIDIDAQKMCQAWNRSLPEDITIRDINMVEDEFHPQANVKFKIYYYHLFVKQPMPFYSRYGFLPGWNFDLDILKAGLNIFIGTHDFRSFSTGYEQEDTIRKIDAIYLIYLKKFKTYQIQIIGQSFLHHMIRRMLGASLDISYSRNRSIEELKKALEEKNPHQNFTTAPAKGLILRKIVYE